MLDIIQKMQMPSCASQFHKIYNWNAEKIEWKKRPKFEKDIRIINGAKKFIWWKKTHAVQV